MSEISPPPPIHPQRQARLSFSERSPSQDPRNARESFSAHSRERQDSVASRLSRSHSRAPLVTAGHRTRLKENGSTNNGEASKGFRDVKSLKDVNNYSVSRDIRTRLPVSLQRFSGYRDPRLEPPYDPLPFPPFSWLRHLSLKYETWLLSLIGSFVGIALVEVIMSLAFPNHDTVLIVASFGASAVLLFATIESPLSQPRHFLGGQILSALLGVGLNRLFRMAHGYRLSDTIGPNELGQYVWLNGAVSMSLSLLLMQVTGTTHPPGGATALIAAVQPAAVNMSWRLIVAVIISSLVMLVWALIINNIGRRRYPSYWLSGRVAFVRDRRRGSLVKETIDEAEMEAEEGRSRRLELELLPEEFDHDEMTPREDEQRSLGQQPKELLRGRKFSRRS